MLTCWEVIFEGKKSSLSPIPTHAHTCTHMPRYTHAHTCIHMHIHAHTCTVTYMHKRAQRRHVPTHMTVHSHVHAGECANCHIPTIQHVTHHCLPSLRGTRHTTQITTTPHSSRSQNTPAHFSAHKLSRIFCYLEGGRGSHPD